MAMKTERKAKLDAYKRDVENTRAELEEAEELIGKQKREISDLRNYTCEVESNLTKVQKHKKRLQNDVDQMNAIFEQEKHELLEIEARLKKANRGISEEKKVSAQLCEERCDLQKKLKSQDIKLDTLESGKHALEKQVTDLELAKKLMQASIESLTESRDAARNLHSVTEKDKAALIVQLNEANRLVSDLSDDLDKSEQNLLAVTASLHSSKEQHAKDVESRDEKLEAARVSLTKLERETRVTLEDEKKKREQLAAAKKGLEATVTRITMECEDANRRVEEQQKQIRKQQTQLAQMREVQAELAEMNEVKENLIREMKELEKRMKRAEMEAEALQEKVQTAERAKKAAVGEILDMEGEVNALKNQLRLEAANERKVLESQLRDLQEEANEDRRIGNENEMLARKLAKDLDVANSKVSELKEDLRNSESTKMRLEKNNKDLEMKAEKLDSTLRDKVRENAQVLEQRMAQLEVTLEGEVRERENLNKQLKKAEKTLIEAQGDLADANDQQDSTKAQLEKVSKKYATMKRENQDLTEDVTRLTHVKAGLDNEVDDMSITIDRLQREMNKKNASATASRVASRSRSRMEMIDDEDLED